ncbi:carboxypeptidase M32 [Prochlorococcus sp. MIT 1300]|uniref:carboxypeptidase M32 n=1 Tax=Prochlorococcus sp. MIT 1300 TaxID=3096218 RepID=UPI002A7568AF|nr:carboxypeptidase M32 [Prochlorococcus sp. MIT 1300]
MPALAWHRLGGYLRETQLLGSIQSTLYWDQNTRMPSGGAAWRGEQLSLLATQIHARQSSSHFESLLEEAESEFQLEQRSGDMSLEEIGERSRNLELLKQDLIRQQRLDPCLVGNLAKAKSDGYNQWQQARDVVDFNFFAPALKNLIALRQEQAKQLSEPRSCWETLAQPFEPDLSLTRLEELFEPLRAKLPVLVEKVRTWGSPSREKWDLEVSAQENLCSELLKDWGQDPAITCVARSPHPFSITLGPCDFRLTTRVVPGQPFSCFLATAHEWGHSLYEQGLPNLSHQWFAWPLGQATSMGVHESQSLFWENRVARSQGFSERWWTKFANFHAPINSAADFWRLINPLTPGLNRVEADELSYGLHILIRTDLEIAMLEGGLPVEDLPLEWNRRYTELLGVTPKNDLEGCLQDVHWSEGLFGYFPSYLLGHLISAQIADAMAKDLIEDGANENDPINSLIAEGSEAKILKWLRANVHPLGRQVNAEQLVKKVSCEELSSRPFLRYLEDKLERLHFA